MSIELFNIFISTLVVLTQVLIVFLLALLLFFRKKAKRSLRYFAENAYILGFAIALVSTLGSLYYSEIANFNPCYLCWVQRVFIYPQTLLLAMAAYRKDNNISYYALALSFVGLVFSVYQNYLYFSITAGPSAFCDITTSCLQRYVAGYSYVTIPVMALTALLAIIILMIIRNKYFKSKNISV